MAITTKAPGDLLTAAEINTMDDAIDAALAALTLPTGARVLGNSVAGVAQPLTASQVLDFVGTARGSILFRGSSGWVVLGPGLTGQVLTTSGAGADPAWAAGGGGGGGGGPETNTWALPTALSNPASPVTPSAIAGSSVIRIGGITGAKTVNMPAASGLTGRVWALFDLRAVGGPFNVTFVGPTFDGIGANPGLVVPVPADGRSTFLAYTDDAGVTWRYSGNYDFADNKATVLAALGIGTLKARFDVLAPVDGTEVLLLENVQIGTIVSALCWTDQGSATANLQIADKTGPTNYTVTGAASITGLAALSVSTTPARTAASGANTMAKTGNTDRVLQVVLSSVTGAPNRLTIELEWAP